MTLCVFVSEDRGDGKGTYSQTLCTCVSQEQGDGEGAVSEASSLLSDIRYTYIHHLVEFICSHLFSLFPLSRKKDSRQKSLPQRKIPAKGGPGVTLDGT